MQQRLLLIALGVSLFLLSPSPAQTADSVFPKGELSLTRNHTGKISLSELNSGDPAAGPEALDRSHPGNH
jgi:hypothetical protein